MNCTTCGNALDPSSIAAGIWVEIMGGAYIYAYVACPACGAYTESCTRNILAGGDREYSSRVISKSEGDALVCLIHTCWDPLDIGCTCPAHAYFRHGFSIGPVILV